MKNLYIIIQARMGSTRLPGKILMKVMGKTLLEYQIERLKNVKNADSILVATTDKVSDEPIVDLCGKLDLPCYRGEEDDVLSRYYHAALESKADTIVRITSDCPIIDPKVVDRVIGFYLGANGSFDYASNCLERTYPRGMDTEVFSFKVLSEAYFESIKNEHREHVTPYIYSQPERYKLANVPYKDDKSQYRLTVDTTEDFQLIKMIIESLYPANKNYSLEDILTLLAQHPEYAMINKNIRQKDDNLVSK